jgi:predicted deacylase
MLLISIIIILILCCFWVIADKSNISAWGENLDYYDIHGVETGPFVCLIAGTHGNEPAGTIALLAFLDLYFSNNFQLQKGHLRIIPCINKWGLKHNSRTWGLTDINRTYNEHGGSHFISKQVVDLTKNADLVVDFHEGWGFRNQPSESMGSTITPTNEPTTIALATAMCQKINDIFSYNDANPKRFSVLLNESCEISTALSCYMENQNRSYILVETSGQNDVQSMEIRIAQINIIINTILQYL